VLPDLERAERIGSRESRAFAELLIDLQEGEGSRVGTLCGDGAAAA